MIIGISGKIKSGKDTVAHIIRFYTSSKLRYYFNDDIYKYLKQCNDLSNFDKYTKYEVKKFGDKLKQVCSIITGIPIENFYTHDGKNMYLPECWNINGKQLRIRDMLQMVGTDAMKDKFHPKTWVNALLSDYNSDSMWLVSDLRFFDEYNSLKEQNSILLRVNRNVEQPEHIKNHRSEIELDNSEFDFVIDNNKDLNNLIIQTKKFVDKFIK